jgi:hypothetical protein
MQDITLRDFYAKLNRKYSFSDDIGVLTRYSGIGLRLISNLRRHGINNIAQLKSISDEDLKLNVRYIGPMTVQKIRKILNGQEIK